MIKKQPAISHRALLGSDAPRTLTVGAHSANRTLEPQCTCGTQHDSIVATPLHQFKLTVSLAAGRTKGDRDT